MIPTIFKLTAFALITSKGAAVEQIQAVPNLRGIVDSFFNKEPALASDEDPFSHEVQVDCDPITGESACKNAGCWWCKHDKGGWECFDSKVTNPKSKWGSCEQGTDGASDEEDFAQEDTQFDCDPVTDEVECTGNGCWWCKHDKGGWECFDSDITNPKSKWGSCTGPTELTVHAD